MNLNSQKVIRFFNRSCWFSVLLLLTASTGCQGILETENQSADKSADSKNDKTTEPEKSKRSQAGIANEKTPRATEAKTVARENVEVKEWLQFRGPNFSHTTTNTYPTNFAASSGMKWKQGLPGRGASTPVHVNGRIFLTAYDGFGLEVKEDDDFRNLRHHVLCFDQETGKCLWQRTIKGTSLLQKMNPELARHGFASSSIATDGEMLFAYFGVTGLFAFDLDGNLAWQRNLGLQTHYFGSSASPILYKNLVIVNASIESQTVFAFEKTTGSIAYMIPQIVECWSTPVIGKNDEGDDELVISHRNTVAGFEPQTGESLWHCKGIQDYVVSVPIIVNGVCYLTGGKQKQTIAVRLGGSGDVDETHKIFDVPKLGANVSSPIYRDGLLFIVHDNGIMQIIDAESGELVKRQRTATRTRPFASPLLAGEHLFMPFQDTGIGVFTADAECQSITENELLDDLPLMASLVPCGKGLLARNDQFLYFFEPSAREGESAAWQLPKDSEKVAVIESYNINPEKQWSRRYLGFITPKFGQTIRFLLMPYQSVITDQQTEQAKEIIRGERQKYEELIKRYEALRWEELKTPASKGSEFHERYAALEKDVKALNEKTRILVKNLFSEEQMEKHYADAKARRAHIKPDPSKSPKQEKE